MRKQNLGVNMKEDDKGKTMLEKLIGSWLTEISLQMNSSTRQGDG